MRPLVLILSALLAMPAVAARRLTLEEAQQLALKQNRTLALARLKVEENQSKRLAARSDYFPKVLADANYLYFNKQLGTTVTAGSLGLGILPPPLPSIPIPIDLVRQNLFFGSVTAIQPLTPLLKVRHGVDAAASDEQIAKEHVRRGRHEVAYAVEQLYYGLLISRAQLAAAELKIVAAEAALQDAQNSVETGNSLAVAALGRRAALLEARQNALVLRNQISDYSEALNSAIGLAITTELELVEPPRITPSITSAAEAVELALRESPEVREAGQLIVKAQAGVGAAQSEYIPDVFAFGQHFYQTGLPAMPSNFLAVGGRLSYTLFEFGKRREQTKERHTQLTGAEENLRHVKEKIEVEVRKSYRNVERSLQMAGVAREALSLRVEGERLNKDQVELGFALTSALAESRAARAGAEADLLRAEAGWRLAYADLLRNIGAQ